MSPLRNLAQSTALKSPQDLVKEHVKISSVSLQDSLEFPLTMELFETQLAQAWINAKQSLRLLDTITPLPSTFKKRTQKTRSGQKTIEAVQESLQLMTESEIAQLNALLLTLFKHDFGLQNKFAQLKVSIDGKQVVLYYRVKKFVFKEMLLMKRIDTSHIPFLNYASVLKKKQGFQREVFEAFFDGVTRYHKKSYLDLVQPRVVPTPGIPTYKKEVYLL